ncbi:hypothetical protein L228DRAFT_51826 [Xylona heveae TC161]|uniref:U4/U6 snRNA-associated-splicing factor PRP24 n=1 Tax=Xylona heveae (strain CBS 132557 / TC161) TaxID=1328760 RepID=A0A164ZDZ0_XYLHT|nr:hypothetical protein L228DRAFT_51826 [Xylona heveae TC161]KZF18982.1 hypothetical protein L228DRAFT_51826 [Xylona heveae TC161]
MDINSLLSPQESPVTETPPSNQSNPPQARRTKSSSRTPQVAPVASSPLSSSNAPVLPHNVLSQAQQMMPSPPIISPSTGVAASATSTPSAEGRAPPLTRQPSTPGMDTLADLATMQHHQQAARASASGLRSAEIYDAARVPSPARFPLHTIPRTHSNTRGAMDLSMTDAPAQTPPPRTFTATSLSESDLKTVAELVGYLAENPYAYESHVQLIKLLHQGFISHIYPAESPDSTGDPHKYDLLDDLRMAREAMESRYPVGEDIWADWIQDEQTLARTTEDRIGVMELCQRAVEEELESTKLWVLYGNWMLNLYRAAHYEPDTSDAQEDAGAGVDWSEEDKIVGKEVFSWQQMLEVWRLGVESTHRRMNDSHLVWDRYMELHLEDLARSPTTETIQRLKGLFIERLRTPHATWDQTFQNFSTFISTYDNASYEDTMVMTTKMSQEAKHTYGLREVSEVQLQRAAESGDRNAEWRLFSEYLDWELGQKRKGRSDARMCATLYERAVLRFPNDPSLWEDYVALLVEDKSHGRRGNVLPVLERATRHCPWSGDLWSQYVVTAETEKMAFEDIEEIKHKATSRGLLDAGTMDEVLKVYTSWCGFLRRRAFAHDATDEELDVAEVGIRSALESVRTIGEKKVGPEYKGDPLYRLERIYIKFLSQSRLYEPAREAFQGLVPQWGTSYEFWLRFYNWEMSIWARQNETGKNNGNLSVLPSHATAALQQGMMREDVDWPEKLIETFIHHCQQHEDAEALQLGIAQARKATKQVMKRREREAIEAAQQQQAAGYFDAAAGAVAPSATEDQYSMGKRKREEEEEEEEEEAVAGAAAKKSRAEEARPSEPQVEEQSVTAESMAKRDRENTTVLVKNLPADTSENRVRQFFRDCGKINSIKLIQEDDTTSASIEFDTKEDVLAAQTRDMKNFEGNSIEIHLGTGSTLFVTNFPPAADESYIRDLFKEFGEVVDVRFPSLKFNTHRRFCYVQFKTSAQAQAATALDGKTVGEHLTLIAKISDPAHKKARSGAIYEGREVYVSNLDWSATEDEVRQAFSKYGKVERARIPTNVAGKSKGVAFIIFPTKEEANAALEMNLTKFKSRVLNVVISSADPAKRQATNIVASSSKAESPESSTVEFKAAEDAEQQSHAHRASSPSAGRPTPQEIRAKTVGLLNVPDTVNAARIRSLMEPYGPLVKVILRPDHQGAIVEFKNINDAGKASLDVEGYEIAPGRKLGVGSVAEMFRQDAEIKSTRIQTGKNAQKSKQAGPSALQPVAPVRRPNQPGARRGGGKGGLGSRRGGFGLGASRSTESSGDGDKSPEKNAEDKMQGVETEKQEKGDEPAAQEGQTQKKSNADFKALFLSGGK